MTKPIESLTGDDLIAFREALRPYLSWILNDEGFKSADHIDEVVAAAQAGLDGKIAAAEGWAEGTLPGGPGTKSAKEWAADSATTSSRVFNSIPFATWAALGATTGMQAGDRARVRASDTGTHTDPVVGGIVANAGDYVYSSVPAGWQRSGDLDSQTANHYANDATDNDIPGGAPGARGAKYWALLAGSSLSSLTASLNDVRATVYGSSGTRSVLGRPTSATLVTGSAVGSATYALSDAAALNSFLEYVDIYNPAASSGAVRIRREAKSGNNFTQVGTDLVLTVAPGNNHITFATFGSWAIQAGERLAINAYTGGVGRLAYITAAGDSGGYYDSAGAGDTGNFTDAAVNTTNQLQLRFGLITSLPVVGIVDQLTALSTSIATNAASIQSLSGLISGQAGGTTSVIGRPAGTTLVTGTAIGGSTYVYGAAASSPSYLQQVDLYNPNGAGTVRIKRFSRSGDNWTQVGTDLVLSVVNGQNTITYDTFGVWPVGAGEYPGIYPRNPGGSVSYVSYVSGSGDSGGYYNSSGDNSSGFTDAGATTNIQLQLRFTLTTSLPINGLTNDVAALKSRVSTLEGGGGADFAGVQPTGYVLVWMIGQSNTSGRATTLSSKAFQAGQAYKYVRASNALATLADPTGNDATAAAGRGSIGPALAKKVQQLSGGKIGVIIVNSAEGGTSIVGTGAWTSTGSSWNQAVTDLGNALTLAATAKLPIVGCAVYMQQGETDGDNGVTGPTYKAAGLDLQSRVQGVIGARVPFLVTRIGTINSGDTTGYATIRQAQDELVEANAGFFMVHSGTRYFAERGLMMDSFHYVIAGYDEIGEAAGIGVFALALGQRPKGYHG